MGFIKNLVGTIGDAAGGVLGNEWLEYFVPREDMGTYIALAPATKVTRNGERGDHNVNGNDNVISNGSKIMVPENYALVTIQDGKITGCVAEPGNYEFRTDDPNSASFLGEGLGKGIAGGWDAVKEQFKFGGIPATTQLAFYVNLKPITGITFGTQSPTSWWDTYMGIQADATVNGTFGVQIVNPLLFIRNFVSYEYLSPNAKPFDMNDDEEPKVRELMNTFNKNLETGIALLSSEAEVELAKQREINPNIHGTDTKIYVKAHPEKFAASMSSAIENDGRWLSTYGIILVEASAGSIDYTEETKEQYKKVQSNKIEIGRVTEMGAAFRENPSLAQVYQGEALKAAAGNENGAMMGFMGMNMAGMAGGAYANNAQQTAAQSQQMQAGAVAASASATDKLIEMKKLLDAGVLSQEEFDAAKKQYLENN